MPAPVVDASVILDFLLGDGDREAVVGMVAAMEDSGLQVPQHWRLEVANAFATRVRKGGLEPERAGAMLRALEAFNIMTDPETNDAAWTDGFRLATNHRLTSYDAAYLELALRKSAPLATFDADLRRAAKAEGVPLL